MTEIGFVDTNCQHFPVMKGLPTGLITSRDFPEEISQPPEPLVWFFVRRRKRLGDGKVIRSYCFPRLQPGVGFGSPVYVHCIPFPLFPLRKGCPGTNTAPVCRLQSIWRRHTRIRVTKRNQQAEPALQTLKITPLDHKHTSVNAQHTYLPTLLSSSLFDFCRINSIRTGTVQKTFWQDGQLHTPADGEEKEREEDTFPWGLTALL